MICKTVWTGNVSCVLKISVTTKSEQRLRLIARDAEDDTRKFTDRWDIVNGNYDIFVRMPLCGWNTVILLFIQDNVEDSTSYKINSITKLPLKRQLDLIDWNNPVIRSFTAFSNRIVYNLGNMPLGDYWSFDKRFYLRYRQTLINYNEEGQPNGIARTPFRISMDEDKTMEASASIVRNYPIPVNMVYMCHEFAHGFENQYLKTHPWIVDPQMQSLFDEGEADTRGALLYYAMGWPRKELCYAWAYCFQMNPTEENEIRANAILQLLKELEEKYNTYNND